MEKFKAEFTSFATQVARVIVFESFYPDDQKKSLRPQTEIGGYMGGKRLVQDWCACWLIG